MYAVRRKDSRAPLRGHFWSYAAACQWLLGRPEWLDWNVVVELEDDMTDTKTIPPGPHAPGQRFCEKAEALDLYDVFEVKPDGRPVKVAGWQDLSDALALVHWRKLVAAAANLVDVLTEGGHGLICNALRAALADVRGAGVPTGGGGG